MSIAQRTDEIEPLVPEQPRGETRARTPRGTTSREEAVDAPLVPDCR